MLSLIKFVVFWVEGKLTLVIAITLGLAAVIGGVLFFGTLPGVGGPELGPDDYVTPEWMLEEEEQSQGEDSSGKSQLLTPTPTTEAVLIPRVEGMTGPEAQDLIESLGLNVVLEYAEGDCRRKEGEGSFEAQHTEPSTGTLVEVGSPIGLYVCWVPTTTDPPEVGEITIIQPTDGKDLKVWWDGNMGGPLWLLGDTDIPTRHGNGPLTWRAYPRATHYFLFNKLTHDDQRLVVCSTREDCAENWIWSNEDLAWSYQDGELCGTFPPLAGDDNLEKKCIPAFNWVRVVESNDICSEGICSDGFGLSCSGEFQIIIWALNSSGVIAEGKVGVIGLSDQYTDKWCRVVGE